VIQGSFTLLARREEFGDNEIWLKSFYDGDVFGEQPVLVSGGTLENKAQSAAGSLVSSSMAISRKQAEALLTRDATCISNQRSCVLEVPNDVKQDFYMVAERNDENEKSLKWLRKVPIFRFTEVFYLLQMVFGLERRTFKYGEYLTKAGDAPDGMFIITKGQCLCVHETIGFKKISQEGENSKLKNKKNFNFSQSKTTP